MWQLKVCSVKFVEAKEQRRCEKNVFTPVFFFSSFNVHIKTLINNKLNQDK